MRVRLSRSVTLRLDQDGAVRVRSTACRACRSCTTGQPDDCSAHVGDGDELRLEPPEAGWSDDGPFGVGVVLSVADMMGQLPRTASTVALLGGTPSLRQSVERVLAASGWVVNAGDAHRSSGTARELVNAARADWAGGVRYDVVVTLDGDREIACLLVRRGGYVVSPVASQFDPGIAAVVQRELTIPTTMDVFGTAETLLTGAFLTSAKEGH